MFDTLSQRLSKTVQDLRGRGRITEDNIGETLREVRRALLEADVALPVVKTFIDAVKQKARWITGIVAFKPFNAYCTALRPTARACSKSVCDAMWRAERCR